MRTRRGQHSRRWSGLPPVVGTEFDSVAKAAVSRVDVPPEIAAVVEIEVVTPSMTAALVRSLPLLPETVPAVPPVASMAVWGRATKPLMATKPAAKPVTEPMLMRIRREAKAGAQSWGEPEAMGKATRRPRAAAQMVPEVWARR